MSVSSVTHNSATLITDYNFPKRETIRAGFCWTSDSVLPTIIGNSSTQKLINGKGTFTDSVRLYELLAPGKTYNVRSYIELSDGDVLYSKEATEFKTDLFEELTCNLVNNNLIIDSENYDFPPLEYEVNTQAGSYQLYTEANNIQIRFHFFSKPETGLYNSTYYYLSGSNTTRVLINVVIDGCAYRVSDGMAFSGQKIRWQ